MKEYKLPAQADVPETIILADGDFPSHPLAVDWLNRCPFVVCCDGAANAYIRSGHIPSAIVGDGDSLLADVREKYGRLIHSEAEQETNDLSKAFRFCLLQGRKRITIMGATGKREDHTLGNISLLADYMEQAEVNMLTDHGMFTPVSDDCFFESYRGQQVSVFNMNATELSGEGLAYPLSVFTNWWQGTLNEATGNRFFIHVCGKVLVFRAM
ncbi:thiamine diphosphokinase [Phocaeicola sp.]